MTSANPLEAHDEFDRETFHQLDLTEGSLSGKSFNHCEFEKCHFFEAKLIKCRFEGCTFRECDLSMASVEESIFLDVAFKTCKLMGVNWTFCKHLHVLKIAFEECALTYGSFFGMDLKSVSFNHCVAREVNFGEADLTEVNFDETDLKDADFLHTTLTRADFRTARHYALHPGNNTVTGAKFSFPEALSLLKAFEIEVDLDSFQQDQSQIE